MAKPQRLTQRQVDRGVQLKLGHMDLLIVKDPMGHGVLLCLKPSPTGKEPRSYRMALSPVSAAMVRLEAQT